MADFATRLGPLTLRNPLMAASGCFGYGVEYAHAFDLSTLGAVVVKGLFLSEREGHVPPRIVETPAGMLNAIGLQGIGVHRFVEERLPELRALGAVTIVNVCGVTLDEYVERRSADVDEDARATLAKLGQLLADEAVNADALQADRVDHAGGRLDDPRGRVALALGEEEALGDDPAERREIDRLRVFDAVAEAAAGGDEGVGKLQRADANGEIHG